MKKNLLFTLLLATFIGYSQDLEWDTSKSFDVVFDIGSVSSNDGVNWEMTISGQAGPYGMAYGSITLTSFGTDDVQGEYFGYFITQVDDKLFRGTTNGLWKKDGNKIKSYAYDNDKVGSIINLVTGSWDLVNRKVNFAVAPLKN
jgi:hypothetical protein